MPVNAKFQTWRPRLRFALNAHCNGQQRGIDFEPRAGGAIERDFEENAIVGFEEVYDAPIAEIVITIGYEEHGLTHGSRAQFTCIRQHLLAHVQDVYTFEFCRPRYPAYLGATPLNRDTSQQIVEVLGDLAGAGDRDHKRAFRNDLWRPLHVRCKTMEKRSFYGIRRKYLSMRPGKRESR
jgi:hypothetical protein